MWSTSSFRGSKVFRQLPKEQFDGHLWSVPSLLQTNETCKMSAVDISCLTGAVSVKLKEIKRQGGRHEELTKKENTKSTLSNTTCPKCMMAEFFPF